MTRSRLYRLATEICNYLKIPKSGVLEHWACTKIANSASVPDDILCETVVQKVGNSKGVSYSKIAGAADKV